MNQDSKKVSKVSFTLTPFMKEELEEQAWNMRASLSELMRIATERLLKDITEGNIDLVMERKRCTADSQQ